MVDFIHFTCNVCLVTSDSTGTVSGTVSARNNVGPVRSRNIFCSGGGTCNSPYRKLVCGPWGKVGSSKERVRTADKHRSVPNTCSLHPTGRATDRPSTLPLMTLEFQELATAITPMATHEAIPHRCRRRRLSRGRCWVGKVRSNNEGL